MNFSFVSVTGFAFWQLRINFIEFFSVVALVGDVGRSFLNSF